VALFTNLELFTSGITSQSWAMQICIAIDLSSLAVKKKQTPPKGAFAFLAPPARLDCICAMRRQMFGSVKPSPATLVRVAFDRSSLALHAKMQHSRWEHCVFGTPGETRLHLRDAQTDVRLGQALAGNARPRCI